MKSEGNGEKMHEQKNNQQKNQYSASSFSDAIYKRTDAEKKQKKLRGLFL